MNGLVTLPTFLSVFPQMKESKIEGENHNLIFALSTLTNYV